MSYFFSTIVILIVFVLCALVFENMGGCLIRWACFIRSEVLNNVLVVVISILNFVSDSGLQGDTLPARQLHGLESERVLQSVRGLSDGKADTSDTGGAQQIGLIVDTESLVQVQKLIIC